MSGKNFIIYNTMTLIMTEKSKSLKYETIKEKEIIRTRDEELKLLFAEINFLNLYFVPVENRKSILVYIGSSPGKHIPKVVKLYPELEYHLYDSVPPSHELAQEAIKNKKVTLFNKDFSLSDIEKYKSEDYDDCDIYVITDFENRNIKNNTPPLEKEDLLQKDMLLQMEWMKELSPKIAFLKFRLPHFYEGTSIEDTIEYLSGTVYRNIYSKSKTIECRLVVTDFTTKTFYNFRKFEETMHYYNYVTRESSVINPITLNSFSFNRFGNGFDVMVMFWILKQYFEVRGHICRASELIEIYNKFISV